jgi:hypothetical protein
LASAEPVDAAAELDDEPVLEQRLSPWLTLRTTVKEQGLVVQVARPFKERVNAVGFERLLLEPAEVSFVRTDRLWLSGALGAAGLALSWPGLLGLPELAGLTEAHAWSAALGALAALLGPGFLAAAVLVLLMAVTEPRRLSVFLDREQAVHPKVVRGRADEPQAAAFIAAVKQAIVRYRCSGPPAEAPGESPAEGEAEEAAQPSLADTLDALLAMRQHGLLDDEELRRFQEFAERR